MEHSQNHELNRYNAQNGWVLIPAFCEELVIGDVVRSVIAEGYRVVVIDDGSSDGTVDQATTAGALTLVHKVNLGQGAALETGMEWARRQKDCHWVVHFDADGQHDPLSISGFLNKLNTVDIVLGSRFLPGGSTPGISIFKKYFLQTAKRVQNILTGVHLSDAHCGIRALTRVAFEKISLQEPGMAHATELVQLIKKHQLSYCEIPVTIKYTAYSVAKGQGIGNAFQIIYSLVIRRFL